MKVFTIDVVARLLSVEVVAESEEIARMLAVETFRQAVTPDDAVEYDTEVQAVEVV